jgi:hypothetical protein
VFSIDGTVHRRDPTTAHERLAATIAEVRHLSVSSS